MTVDELKELGFQAAAEYALPRLGPASFDDQMFRARFDTLFTAFAAMILAAQDKRLTPPEGA